MQQGFTHIDWPAPPNVIAYSTTMHGDLPATPSTPKRLQQVHGADCVDAATAMQKVAADAAYTNKFDTVCIIETADCLPILICDKQGTEIAAVHAGWRSLSAQVITNTVQMFKSDPKNCIAWLGPCIGPEKFEVDADVLEDFAKNSWSLEQGFTKVGQKWHVDLYALARINLQQLGFAGGDIYGGGWCTYSQADTYFSYRRSKGKGRMQHLIWLNNS